MQIGNLLEQIRPTWLNQVSYHLAHGEEVRESFLPQLDRFFSLLVDTVESENPTCLEPVLSEWIKARTQSDLEAQTASIPPILNSFLQITYETARECLSEPEALLLLGAVLPVYTHAFEYTTRQETQLYIEHISAELSKANLALEKLDKSKSDFISIAAHELRTPLTLIEGYSSMLREVIPAEALQSTAGVYMKGIDTGFHRLREIVDDMIDVSMIDNNMLSINFQPVWINRLMVAVQRELRDSLNDRRQSLTVLPFPGSNEMTYGDGERLLQALRNLVSNAIKYTPDGGSITVNGRLLPGFIEITIADNGIGIDPEDHLRIFEKFGRLGSVSLHSSSKTKFKGGGPGLGLSITKGIIEAHGGAIWVESDGYDEVNCPGSTFHILLPLRKDAPDILTGKLFGKEVNVKKKP